jgi:hypothetical protein
MTVKFTRQYKVVAFAVIAIAALAIASRTQYAIFPIQSSSLRPEHCLTETYDTKPDIQENSLTTVSSENGKYVVKKCVGNFVFKNLPPFPDYFNKIHREICYQRIGDLSFYDQVGVNITPYYYQPEILGAADCSYLFDETGLQFYAGYEENQPGNFLYKFGQIGYGAYPGSIYKKIEKNGGKINTTVFFHTSFGIVTYQGFNLVPYFPSNGNFQNEVIEQNSETVKNYIDVKINDNIFVLEPTWPIFKKNWIKRVDMTLDVSPDTPKGKYLITIVPGPLPEQKENEWKIAYYWANFISVGSSSFSVVGEPPIKILLEVE